MDLEKITEKSIDEVYEVIQTEEFNSKVNGDAIVPLIIEYSKILLTNYHQELSAILKSKGIDI